jgi:hypothetical protein
MEWVRAGVRGILLAALAGGCGGESQSSSNPQKTGGSAGAVDAGKGGAWAGQGGASGNAAGTSAQDGGASAQGSGGDLFVPVERCSIVAGQLAYGPIGEPQPFPDDGVLTSTCSQAFEPGAREPGADPNGLTVVPAGASDEACAPLWMGEGYLSAFADSRGLVVALLDAEGVVVSEQTLPNQTGDSVKARFSRNGDRALLVFRLAQQDRPYYGVFDARGTLLGELRPIGKEQSNPIDFSVAVDGDGWTVVVSVASPSVPAGTELTGISRDGLVRLEQAGPAGGYATIRGFAKSAYGGFLLVTIRYSGGQFGTEYKHIALIDDAGGVAFSETATDDEADSWPISLVNDPLRDLIVQSSRVESSYGMRFVQEYGCLD